MKKFNPFKSQKRSIPKVRKKDLSREVLFTQDFGKVQLNFWDIVNPGEPFSLRDNTKLLSTPFVGPQYSSIFMKTRYFAVPLRKAVPHFEEFILSSPSDNVTEYHTTLYDLFRAQMYDVRISQTDRRLVYQSLQPDGLTHYVGIPYLLDQLCIMTTGHDLQYMEEWTAILLSRGATLDANGNYTTFHDYFEAMISLVNPSYPFAPSSYAWIWTSGNYDSDHPNQYQAAPFQATSSYNDNIWALHLPSLLTELGHSMEGFIDYIVDNGNSLDDGLNSVLSDVAAGYRIDSISGRPSDNDIKNGFIIYLAKFSRDADFDYSQYFFGQVIRLAPFCAYQKVRYDWFTDLRFNDDVYEEFFNYVTENVPSSHYVRYSDLFTYTSKITQQPVSRNILAFLLTNFVIDYQKDYFTTASLQPQAGPDLVIGPKGKLDLMFDVDYAGVYDVGANAGSVVSTGEVGQLTLVNSNDPSISLGHVWAKINDSDEITPIKLRWQMALQKLTEVMNIGGYSRYTDLMLGQYGIRVPDPYLLRSIYLGGYRTAVNTNPVVAQSDGMTEESSAMIGDIAAYGSARAYGPVIKGYVNEHVCLVGVNYVVPQNYYFQGLRTALTDINLLDYPRYQFSHVGEQPVRNREIFLGAQPSQIFGYQRRYSDKKFAFDELHGEFVTNLRHWHTGRKFLAQPHLNQELLSLRGQDGHNDILVVNPRVSLPFRCIKYINYFKSVNY